MWKPCTVSLYRWHPEPEPEFRYELGTGWARNSGGGGGDGGDVIEEAPFGELYEEFDEAGVDVEKSLEFCLGEG